jgi:hypothetical protein
MEISVTDFKKNISTYFDNESNFDNAVKSKKISNKLSLLATKL